MRQNRKRAYKNVITYALSISCCISRHKTIVLNVEISIRLRLSVNTSKTPTIDPWTEIELDIS